ncbi:uncharacterized protein B0I36DRAFT_151284 [Microdochium trichocladiopsis]|uniref:Uncharacterized protein n=1 Tax=Microdochium trichocladiopsis TaxID=1682393 RepID=A0A9P9BMJ8_9PEZI|nr:uncharacterized protein B0I36DRAFT_151284 [Microdochium trichocladiopsis]KAH7025931.1 hypothetical protein B0I36DRAFT_151284 [Microdochium trichocladiopsis]
MESGLKQAWLACVAGQAHAFLLGSWIPSGANEVCWQDGSLWLSRETDVLVKTRQDSAHRVQIKSRIRVES